MKSQLSHTVPPEIASQWRTRLELLEQKLRDASGDEQAWLWEIQWYIIAYLLGRYAGQEIKTRPNPATFIPPAELPLEQPPPLPGNIRPSHMPTVPPGMGKPPRSSTDIRRYLQTITQGNQDRYQLLQQLRELYLHDLRIDALERRLFILASVEIDQQLDQLATDKPSLTEDGIVDLVT